MLAGMIAAPLFDDLEFLNRGWPEVYGVRIIPFKAGVIQAIWPFEQSTNAVGARFNRERADASARALMHFQFPRR
jgi:hypothetical protein